MIGRGSDELTEEEDMEEEMREQTPASKILIKDGKWSESVSPGRQAEWSNRLSKDPLCELQIKWEANERF